MSKFLYLVTIILLLGICYPFRSSICSALPGSIKSSCYYADGVYTGSFDSCKKTDYGTNLSLTGLVKIQQARQTDVCFYKASINANKATFCAPITDDILRGLCYSRFAVTHDDPGFCNAVTDQGVRDQCYYGFQYNTKQTNIDLCPQIKDPTLRSNCELNV